MKHLAALCGAQPLAALAARKVANDLQQDEAGDVVAERAGQRDRQEQRNDEKNGHGKPVGVDIEMTSIRSIHYAEHVIEHRSSQCRPACFSEDDPGVRGTAILRSDYAASLNVAAVRA